MADFSPAYDMLMKHEGKYANDPDDRGGETYRGIARNFHGNWEGWSIIDAAKSQPNFPNNLEENSQLQDLVYDFYKRKFWDSFWGDKISNQDIAIEIFEFGVNAGIGRSVKRLQRALNVLDRDGKLYNNLIIDGAFGNKTLSALNVILSSTRDSETLFKMLNVLQGSFYIEIMEKRSSQEKYARGWFNRVEILKKS